MDSLIRKKKKHKKPRSSSNNFAPFFLFLVKGSWRRTEWFLHAVLLPSNAGKSHKSGTQQFINLRKKLSAVINLRKCFFWEARGGVGKEWGRRRQAREPQRQAWWPSIYFMTTETGKKVLTIPPACGCSSVTLASPWAGLSPVRWIWKSPQWKTKPGVPVPSLQFNELPRFEVCFPCLSNADNIPILPISQACYEDQRRVSIGKHR